MTEELTTRKRRPTLITEKKKPGTDNRTGQGHITEELTTRQQKRGPITEHLTTKELRP
jgi:hypothetical protein